MEDVVFALRKMRKMEHSFLALIHFCFRWKGTSTTKYEGRKHLLSRKHKPSLIKGTKLVNTDQHTISQLFGWKARPDLSGDRTLLSPAKPSSNGILRKSPPDGSNLQAPKAGVCSNKQQQPEHASETSERQGEDASKTSAKLQAPRPFIYSELSAEFNRPRYLSDGYGYPDGQMPSTPKNIGEIFN
ncbi:hypothetical protein PABG_12051 [Paracoccidioides brasiliensis Pb03]|nr:hypothetical protein PABG_12051 [Paracoccidioides brasiliensis Pb03]